MQNYNDNPRIQNVVFDTNKQLQTGWVPTNQLQRTAQNTKTTPTQVIYDNQFANNFPNQQTIQQPQYNNQQQYQQPPQQFQPQYNQQTTQQYQQPPQQFQAPKSQSTSTSYVQPTAGIQMPEEYKKQAAKTKDPATAWLLNSFASTLEWADAQHRLINQSYQALWAMLDPQNKQYSSLMSWIDKQTKDFLNQQKQLFDSQFWPWWELVSNIKWMWNDLNNYLATKNAEEQALAQAQAWQNWADPAQLSATLAWLESKQLADALKVNQQTQQQLQWVYSVYQNLLNNYQQQYAWSTDKNVVQTYKDLLNQSNALKSAWVQSTNQLNSIQLQNQMAAARQAAAAKQQQASLDSSVKKYFDTSLNKSWTTDATPANQYMTPA